MSADDGSVLDVGAATESVSSGADDAPLHALESLCMRCGDNGTTRILITKIPHFREVVLMAFECPHCNERNNEVQFAGQFQPQGCKYALSIPAGDPKVLNRQVVKSDSGTIKAPQDVIVLVVGPCLQVPELDFEVPPEAQRGTLSTVEGVLLRAAEELEALQPERRKIDLKTAEAIDAFLVKLKACASGEQAFTFVIDDPSGNSFVENPDAPAVDPLLATHYYDRSAEQHVALGLLAETHERPSVNQTGASVSGPSEPAGEQHSSVAREQIHGYTPAGTTCTPHGSVGAEGAHRAIAHGNTEAIAAAVLKYSAPEEVMTFPSTCGSCAAPCETRMFVTNIPYFKEVIVMASTCDNCGYRNSELKPGGSIPEKGRKICLRIKNKEDLNRDVIKSDSATVEVPEVDLELASGTLGGLVTTVEGLISQISENLKRVHGFSIGDSADPWQKSKWQDFDRNLKKLLNVEEEWTLILDDALSNSFIAPATDDYEGDSQLTTEEYARTWEQDEDLGLHDIDTSSADVAYETANV